MLTRKQYELLTFIEQRLRDSGVAPSFDEMKEALQLRSKSGIHRLITALEERGFLRRLPHRARALEITRLPSNAGEEARPPVTAKMQMIDARQPPGAAYAEPRYTPPAYTPPTRRPRLPQGNVHAAREAMQLPLYGRIAAGTPIEALRDHSVTVEVPPSMLGGGEHYALEVDGDSMVEAGIMDGDTVIIQRCDTADSGAIVVALVDNQEVTLKRLRRRGVSVALEPANVKYETRIFPPERVRVQGKLVGLLRRY